jgi:AcrR family transcriptional regulator
MTDTKPPRRNSKAGRPREPISKDVLLLIASRHFAAQGYKAASLDDIAGEAGLSKQAVLHHFHGKEALYLAVMDHHVLALSGLVMEALTATGDFAARLDQLGDVMVDYFASHRDAASLLLREALDDGLISGVRVRP